MTTEENAQKNWDDEVEKEARENIRYNDFQLAVAKRMEEILEERELNKKYGEPKTMKVPAGKWVKTNV
jgi:hypothetical protein